MIAMAPDLQPTLNGKTIRIRRLWASDWPDLFAAASDPKIWEIHPQPDRYKETVFRDFFETGLSAGALAFVVQGSDAVVGSSRYHAFDPQAREIEIGWTFLIPRLWGGGANREIKFLMLSHAFTFADTVLFCIGEKNLRSCRAMEKIGGVGRPQLQNRPPMGPHVIYEITKTGFASNPYWRD